MSQNSIHNSKNKKSGQLTCLRRFGKYSYDGSFLVTSLTFHSVQFYRVFRPYLKTSLPCVVSHQGLFRFAFITATFQRTSIWVIRFPNVLLDWKQFVHFKFEMYGNPVVFSVLPFIFRFGFIATELTDKFILCRF